MTNDTGYTVGNSFVIVRLTDRKAICELYNTKLLASLNTDKYEAVPIHDYLCSIAG